MELKIEHVKKSFQKHCAVNDVNLTLHSGVIGLLGANGSGKTTLLRMLVGNIKPQEGHILFDGVDISKNYEAYVANVGYMPQHLGFYPEFTVMEFLQYMAMLKGLKKTYAKERIMELLECLSLVDKQRKKIKTLSGGMLRRVGIAQSLLNTPKILILDEPTAGLDPKERIVLRNLIAHQPKDTLVILSTHIVSDIESIADEIIIMKEGSILMHETPDEILKRVEGNVFEVRVAKEESRTLEEKYTIVNYHQIGEQMCLRLLAQTSPHPDAHLVTPTLDDVYLYYFDQEEREE